jgi:hypothetical protein
VFIINRLITTFLSNVEKWFNSGGWPVGVQSLLANFMDAATQAASSLVCNLIPIDCWFKFVIAGLVTVDK